MEHSAYCAVLACAVSLLSSGLEDILLSMRRVDKKPSSLCQLCCKIVVTKQQDILESLTNLIQKFNCDAAVSRQPRNVRVCRITDCNADPDTTFGSIERGVHGRMLVASQSLIRGTIVLTDLPYCSCTASTCGCSEGALLADHVRMAAAVKYCEGRDVRRHDAFLANIFSALDDASTGWNDHMLCTMCLTCCLLSLYTLRQESRALSANPHFVPTEPRLSESVFLQRHRSDSLELLEILARLPHNVHAVSKMKSVASKSLAGHSATTVQQVRVGYNLYLTASAVNHSCSPNACVRFEAPNCTSESLVDRLFGTRVEVVSTDSAARRSEVTVSYGPLAGTHDVSARRRCLSSQYLFHCRCSACEADSGEASLLPDAPKTCGEGRLGKQMETEPLAVLDTTLLCDQLHGMTREVTAILEDMGGVMRDKARLAEFETARLVPLGKRLQQMQSARFPETVPWMRDCADKPWRTLAMNGLCSEFCGVLLTYLDVHAHLLALRCEYAAAAELISSAISLMVACGRYRWDDVVVGRERVKLSQLQLSAGNRRACLETVRRAIDHLRPCVSTADPDWVEACAIHDYLTRR